jgi:hypothetical protein
VVAGTVCVWLAVCQAYACWAYDTGVAVV